MNKRSSEGRKRQGTRTTLDGKRRTFRRYLKEQVREQNQRRGQWRQRSCRKLQETAVKTAAIDGPRTWACELVRTLFFPNHQKTFMLSGKYWGLLPLMHICYLHCAIRPWRFMRMRCGVIEQRRGKRTDPKQLNQVIFSLSCCNYKQRSTDVSKTRFRKERVSNTNAEQTKCAVFRFVWSCSDVSLLGQLLMSPLIVLQTSWTRFIS